MKLILIALFPFLCVKCTPWEECEEDVVPSCLTIEEIIPEVESTYPYQAGDLLTYSLTNNSSEATGSVEKIDDVLVRRFECEEVVEFVLSIEQETQFLHIRSFIIGDTLEYRHLISPTGVGAVQILQTGVEISPDGVAELVAVQAGQRMVADTMLESRTYRDVLVTEYEESDRIKTIYLTKEEGFVQFDFSNGLRVYVND